MGSANALKPAAIDSAVGASTGVRESEQHPPAAGAPTSAAPATELGGVAALIGVVVVVVVVVVAVDVFVVVMSSPPLPEARLTTINMSP